MSLNCLWIARFFNKLNQHACPFQPCRSQYLLGHHASNQSKRHVTIEKPKIWWTRCNLQSAADQIRGYSAVFAPSFTDHTIYSIFQDKKADLVISTYVDDVLEKVLKRMGIELPEYNVENDPTKQKFCELEWTIPSEMIKAMEKVYNDKVKAARKRKSAAAEEADEKVDKKKVKSETKDNDIKANCHEIKIENGIQIEDGIKVVPDERGTNAGCETEDTNGCAPQSDSIVGSEEVTVANGDGGKSKEAQNGASVGSSGDGESKTNEEMSKNGDNDVVTGER